MKNKQNILNIEKWRERCWAGREDTARWIQPPLVVPDLCSLPTVVGLPWAAVNCRVDINAEMKDVAAWMQVRSDPGLLASKDGDFVCIQKYVCACTEENQD